MTNIRIRRIPTSTFKTKKNIQKKDVATAEVLQAMAAEGWKLDHVVYEFNGWTFNSELVLFFSKSSQ